MPFLAIMVIILGIALMSFAFAYFVVILIVGYNLAERNRPRTLEEQYVEEDAISTEEYVRRIEREWSGKKHVPLR